VAWLCGLVVSVVIAFSICRAVGFFITILFCLLFFIYFSFSVFLVVNLLVAPSFV